ncbi:energy transducer TonB [Ichthyobacterium seriolicida]|uniref:TonB family protein n=1 Tax=Ichthyobacterium seriolicida TaxID=242600 RepID=A0A1J1E571_9FLAO|nr:energy transducer TonB [Ichthyobacterium seriolicida]BAV95204.1 TonB family protein [Ichthyobacterium seriolicida]
MELKKNPKADVDRNRVIYIQVGLIIALLCTYIALEWKTYDKVISSLGVLSLMEEEDEIVPITQRETPPPPPPPPPPSQEIINIVEDDIKLEEELDIPDTEISEEEAVEIIDEEEVDEVFNFMVVEDQPVFPGCEDVPKKDRYMCFQKGIMNFIRKNFVYPEIAKEMGIQGKVIVGFVIKKDGNVSDIRVIRGVDKHLDQEAIRLISKLPRIMPAKQRGKPVKVTFNLPVFFKLQ